MRALLIAGAMVTAAGCAALLAPDASMPKPHHHEHDERPDAPGERAQFDFARRVGVGESEIDPARYRLAQDAAARMPAFSTVAGRMLNGEKTAPRWESLGPSNVGGRTRTLAFDPRNGERMLAGGVSGGVWESLDAGASWHGLTDDAANINIGALVFDPVTPDTIYAGTGELYRNNARPYAAMWGQGILRSTDNGVHFRQLLATANNEFRYVSDIVISRHDHQRLYAATNTGVWRSDDGGSRFVQVLRPTDSSEGLLYEGCTDLELVPEAGSADVLLASCASRSENDRYWLPGTVVPPACGGPCPATVFRTDDAAIAAPGWTVVLSEPGMGRTSLALAPSDPNILYAVAASTVPGPDRNGDGRGDYDNGLHAVFRSNDGGRSWQARVRNTSSDVLSTYLLSYADGFEAVRCGFGSFDNYSAGWYNQAIAVNPLNPEVVWVAGMEHYRSDNGGVTFGKASYWWLDGSSIYGIHADQHLIRFHPDYAIGTRGMYVTNDGGVGMTQVDSSPTRTGAVAACGPGSGTVPWATLETGLTSSQFYTGAVNATGTLWLGGLQDNGTVLQRAGAINGEFAEIFGGDGASVAIDPRNDDTLYVAYQNVTINRSIDGGRTFTEATNGISDATIFIMPYVLDERMPDRLFAGGSRLWRTNNQGRNWAAASASLGGGFTSLISAIAVNPIDNNRLLLANSFAIYRTAAAATSTGNTTFANVSPRQGWVSSLTYDPVDVNVAYATYSSFGGDHVWRSSDGGASWSAIDGSGDGRLPDIPVHHLVIDPNNRSRLYLGTDIGVFVSLDGGAHWAQENAGFANVIVERLAIAPNAAGGVPMLFAFTYGRGAWRVPLADFDAVAAYRIGADSSGSFYDPAQDGHGWIVEATNVGGVTGVVATWYTYLNGEQVWLVGAAPADGDSVRVPLAIAHGGGFPPNFDPASVQLEPWGEAVLQFADHDHATVSWTSTRAGFADGSMPLTRLSEVAADNDGSTSGLRSCHSGSWFQPAQNGHGLQVEVLGPPGNQQLLVVWFVYLNGAQRWLLGIGPIVGDSATLAMTITSGGQFPPNFDPASVVRAPWGSLTFRVTGNDSAHIDWQSSLPGYGNGGLDLVRLTGLLGRECL